MPLLMIGAQPLIKKKLSYLVTMRPLFVLFVTCEKNDGHLDHMMVIKSHTYSYQCQGGYFSLGGTSFVYRDGPDIRSFIISGRILK